MADPITNAELMHEASQLGFSMDGWIRRFSGPREEWGKPASNETVRLFVDTVREQLDRIERRMAPDYGRPDQDNAI